MRRDVLNNLEPGMVFRWLRNGSSLLVLGCRSSQGGMGVIIKYQVYHKNGRHGQVFETDLNPHHLVWVE